MCFPMKQDWGLKITKMGQVSLSKGHVDPKSECSRKTTRGGTIHHKGWQLGTGRKESKASGEPILENGRSLTNNKQEQT